MIQNDNTAEAIQTASAKPQTTVKTGKSADNKGQSAREKKELEEALAFEKAALEMSSLENHEYLHYIPSVRLGSLAKVNDKPDYVVTTRQVDMEKLSPEVEATLLDLIETFTQEVSHWVNILELRDYRHYCIGNLYQDLRDQLVAGTCPLHPGKYESVTGLQARMWKLSLQVAASVQSNRWRKAQVEVSSALRKRSLWKNLPGGAKSYVGSMLNGLSKPFFAIMKGETDVKCLLEAPENENKVPQELELPPEKREALCKLIRRKVNEQLGSTPVMTASRSVWFDCECFEMQEIFREELNDASKQGNPRAVESKDGAEASENKIARCTHQQLSVMTKVKGERIALPLKGCVSMPPVGKPEIWTPDKGKKGWKARSVHTDASGNKYVERKQKLRCSTIRVIRTETGFKVIVQEAFSVTDPIALPESPSELLKTLNLPASMQFMRIVGLDMGATEVFVDDDGESWGADEDRTIIERRRRKGKKAPELHERTQHLRGLGSVMREYAEWRDKKLAERNKYAALAKNAETRAERRKIERNNLGSKRFEKRNRAYRVRITDLVNRAINELIAKKKANVYVLECFGQFFDFKGISKATRRYLSSWVRGLIKDRFKFKCAKRGITVVEVAAAYSSQACPCCHSVTRDNRSGDRHHCLFCGHKAHADRVGGYAMLTRAHDPRFKQYMSREWSTRCTPPGASRTSANRCRNSCRTTARRTTRSRRSRSRRPSDSPENQIENDIMNTS